MRLSKVTRFAVGSLLSLSVSAIALGQTAATSELEEVVVTAEKREVNLQKVSTSIEVKSGEELREQGKKRIDEIMQGTVGIQAQDSQVGVTFFVRGVDSSAGMGGVVAVPILVDGVVQSRSESVRGGTLDVARAEIMRGPQSSTLGVNALAGAVSLVSNKPVFEYEANGSLTFGNYHLRSGEAVLNVPLTSNQALRFAYSTEKRLGYISSGAGDSDLTNARAKYRWQPNEDVDLVATLSHQNIGGNGVQQGVLLATGRWVPYTAANFPGLTFTGCAPNGPTTTMGCPVVFGVQQNGVNFRQRADAWNDGYPPRSFPSPGYRDTNIDIASVELNWTTGIGTLTFLPAYQKAHFRSQEPPRGTSYMAEDQKQNTTTLDLRLSSPGGTKFEWQVGAYYSQSRTTDGVFKNVDYPGGMGCPVGAVLVNCYSYDLTPLFEREAGNIFATGEYSLTDTLRLIGSLRYNDDSANVEVLSIVPAPGGPPGPPPAITGTDVGPSAASLAAASRLTGEGAWKETTYRAGIEWDFMPGQMVYAVYNTGYSPGALDTMTRLAGLASTLEQTTLGIKTQWLDNRLQVNAEGFMTTFHNRLVEGQLATYVNGANSSNCQVGFPPPPGSFALVNNGAAGQCFLVNQNQATVREYQSKGVDLDMTWLITPNDRLSLTAEMLDAAYDAAPVIADGQVGGSITSSQITAAFIQGLFPAAGLTTAQAQALAAGMQDTLTGLVGRPLQNAPKWSGTLDYSHIFTLGSGNRITPRIAAVYKQKYWSFGGAPGANVSAILANSSDPNNLAWQQAYTKWDLYTTWEKADGKFSVTGYMKNLGNKVVLANYTDPYVSLEAPKTYGFTFNASF